MRLICLHGRGKVCDIQQICLFGNQFLSRGKTALIAKRLTDIRFNQRTVIFRTKIANAVFNMGDFVINFAQNSRVRKKLIHCNKPEAAFCYVIKPCGKGSRFVSALVVINGNAYIFHRKVCCFYNIGRNNGIFCGSRYTAGNIGFFYYERFIVDFQLIEIYFW